MFLQNMSLSQKNLGGIDRPKIKQSRPSKWKHNGIQTLPTFTSIYIILYIHDGVKILSF